ncbi:hypothetical protein GLX30_24420 [Streptomyces sp. Tu 2975]|uniref:hypothetical protein n=1 Tax=Streptomyces sp. Tu 2975 TaxID=2676871 RepID=UPI00135B53BF|nr:hypothetical protein [Streptomyces sp. Tu 2975]QIP86638.1 hypothetical protein GLX30_24420 [Streptomyces sp. Tu 2975]
MDDQLRRAASALTAAGLSRESPVSCGDHYQHGGGTYHYVNYGEDDDAVLISTLGPFGTGHRGGSSREAREALEAPASAASTRRPATSRSPTCASTTSATARL